MLPSLNHFFKQKVLINEKKLLTAYFDIGSEKNLDVAKDSVLNEVLK